MVAAVEFTLAYYGRDADHNGIDFYDASRALVGFQRTIALTTHLVLNDEVITQTTSLKGARIILLPPSEGSWKATGLLVLGALWYGGTVSKDTPIGNLLSSAYDYVINETLGFHVDYSKTLGQQYEKYKATHPRTKILKPSRFDSVAEKCTSAVVDMHRPIAFSGTAKCARIFNGGPESTRQVGHDFDLQTFDYVNSNIEGKDQEIFIGSVSSYNLNSFTGRAFAPATARLISFYLTDTARTKREIARITRSLAINSEQDTQHSDESSISLIGRSVRTKTGRLKKIIVTDVFDE